MVLKGQSKEVKYNTYTKRQERKGLRRDNENENVQEGTKSNENRQEVTKQKETDMKGQDSHIRTKQKTDTVTKG